MRTCSMISTPTLIAVAAQNLKTRGPVVLPKPPIKRLTSSRLAQIFLFTSIFLIVIQIKKEFLRLSTALTNFAISIHGFFAKFLVFCALSLFDFVGYIFVVFLKFFYAGSTSNSRTRTVLAATNAHAQGNTFIVNGLLSFRSSTGTGIAHNSIWSITSAPTTWAQTRILQTFVSRKSRHNTVIVPHKRRAVNKSVVQILSRNKEVSDANRSIAPWRYTTE